MTKEQHTIIEKAAADYLNNPDWKKGVTAGDAVQISFIAGAEYAFTHFSPGWVRADQPPSVNEKYSESDYLLCLLDTLEQVVCWYNGNGRTWHVANFKADNLPIKNITHWRQLPEPPKEDETAPPSDKDKEIERLRAALIQSVEVIRQWHGYDPLNMWDTYYADSPEMKPIREALNTREV